MCMPHMSQSQGQDIVGGAAAAATTTTASPHNERHRKRHSYEEVDRAVATAAVTTATTTASPHNERHRKRHSYEEVDVDWPAALLVATTEDNKLASDDDKIADNGTEDGNTQQQRHSYEDVDFNHSEANEPGADAGHLHITARAQAPVRINLSHTIRRLRMCGWYWGDISSEQAKEILKRTQNGSFILRDSSDACHLFTLSLKANNIIVSVRVAFSRGMFKLDSWNQEDSPSFSSVVDMIEYYLEDETHQFYVELPNYGEFAVCLKHPIWKEVPDLQHLCRTTVVKYCRTSDKLRLLPLPPHLIRYVLEFSPEDENGNGTDVRNSRGTASEDSPSPSPSSAASSRCSTPPSLPSPFLPDSPLFQQPEPTT